MSRITLDKNGKELTALRRDIEYKAGRALKTSTDFVTVSSDILEHTHEYISVNTLKRIWNYISDDNIPSLSTLNLLSRFLGYADWDEFLKNLDHTGTSQAFFADGIRTDDINVDDKLQLTWRPDRKIVVKYTGNYNFVVEVSENSKLGVGDTFKCMYFIEGIPLFMDQLTHEGFEQPRSYVCGKQGGIHITKL